MQRSKTLSTYAAFAFAMVAVPHVSAAQVKQVPSEQSEFVQQKVVHDEDASQRSPVIVTAPLPTRFATPPGEPVMVRGAASVQQDPVSQEARPLNWLGLYAGIRPRLGTFGGLASLALVESNTDRFYGGFSAALIRNEASLHAGALQFALGRNGSQRFYGGLQLSLVRNEAQSFAGLAQVTPFMNRADQASALAQASFANHANDFRGGAQIGFWNRSESSCACLVQIGATNMVFKAFDFSTAYTRQARSNDGVFRGAAQVGVTNLATHFAGLGQFGLVNAAGSFVGVAQIGLLGSDVNDFYGVAQLGLVSLSQRSFGIQVGPILARAGEEHTGLQIGGFATYAEEVRGGQIGLVNMAHQVKGVQIGLINAAESLRGVQIGLVNHAKDGVLPWTAVINVGFGDGPPLPEPLSPEPPAGNVPVQIARSRSFAQ
jgi:hypothetical protein